VIQVHRQGDRALYCERLEFDWSGKSAFESVGQGTSSGAGSLALISGY